MTALVRVNSVPLAWGMTRGFPGSWGSMGLGVGCPGHPKTVHGDRDGPAGGAVAQRSVTVCVCVWAAVLAPS